MQKNVSGQKWIVFAFDRTDNTPKTGDAANITANLRIDGGGANAVDDANPSELEDGYYVFDITQAECNGDMLVICPASGSADIQVIGVPGAVYTTPENFPAMGIESDGDLTKVNTLDGHTAQTADHTAGLADVPTVAEFEARTLAAADYVVTTDTIAGVTTVTNLTNAPTSGDLTATMKASVNTEADTALSDFAPPTKAEMDTAHGLLATEAKQDVIDGIVDTILIDTAELQGNQGNWATITGHATEAKQDIIDGIVDNILVDTAVIGALGAGLTAIPWNSAWDAEVQSECADALTAYDPPTKAEMDTAHGLLATEAKQDIIDTVVDAVKAKTDNLPADPASETNVDANETKIDTIDTVVDAIKVVTDALTAAAAAKLALSAGTIVVGTVSHDNTAATTTVFYSDDVTEATADHYNGRLVCFTSGALQNQYTDITDYELSAGEGKLTVTALTEAPGDNATFVIV